VPPAHVLQSSSLAQGCRPAARTAQAWMQADEDLQGSSQTVWQSHSGSNPCVHTGKAGQDSRVRTLRSVIEEMMTTVCNVCGEGLPGPGCRQDGRINAGWQAAQLLWCML
jgi:hypothetical protein